MAEKKIYANQSATTIYRSPDSNFSSGVWSEGNGDFYIGFPGIPNDLKYKKISGITFAIFLSPWADYPGQNLKCKTLIGPWNERTLTFNNAPSHRTGIFDSYISQANKYYETYKPYSPELVKELLQFGAVVWGYGYDVKIGTTRSGNKPYVVITYEDKICGIDITQYNDTQYASFESRLYWKEYKNPTLEEIKRNSAKVEWREKGSATIHTVNTQGEGYTEVKIPAGTYQTTEIEWRVIATSNSGVTTTTPWKTEKVNRPEIAYPSPTSGFVSKVKPNKFTWEVKELGSNVKQVSADFKWRPSGTSAWNIIPAGEERQVIVPAGTFKTESVEWQVEAKTEYGYTAVSEIFALSTTEVKSKAVAVRPKDNMIDRSIDNVFQWEHIISTGTEQTGFDIQTGKNDGVWSLLKSEKTAAEETTILANSLPDGEIYWRVRTYNTDNAAGEWSAPAKVVVVAAPPAPPVAVLRATPSFVIRWTQTEQQAFEISLNGKVLVRKFGQSSRYESEEYLPDGTYTVQVRIQNKFGYWSDPGQAAMNIKNAPPGTISASSKVDRNGEVELDWYSSVAGGQYTVLRDGAKIARTKDSYIIDRFAAGETNYEVMQEFPDTGNYIKSQKVRAFVPVNGMQIVAVNGRGWIDVRGSAEEIRKIRVSSWKDVAYSHFAGQALPSAEIGEATDKTISFDVAWMQKDHEMAEKWEALLGQLVCIKLRAGTDGDGERYFGILNEIDRISDSMMITATASVRVVEWEELQ